MIVIGVLMVHIYVCVCVFLHENGSGEGKKEDCLVLLVMQFGLNQNYSVILPLHNEVSEVMIPHLWQRTHFM